MLHRRACLLTAPQKATLSGGTYLIDRTTSQPSSLSVPLLPGGSLPSAPSGTTPRATG